MKKLLIFDLDGTIADTIYSIQHAINLAMQKFGYPEKSYEDVKSAIGDGAFMLLKRVIPQDVAKDNEAVKKVLRCYEDMYDITYSEANSCYDGMHEALEELKHRGYTIAILSNKQDNYVKLIASQIIKSGIVSLASGQKEGFPTKPDPTLPKKIARDLGFADNETIFIGDSEVDIMTAKNAGFSSIGCAWGYRDENILKEYGADVIIHHPKELVELLK